MKSDGSKRVKNDKVSGYGGSIGSSKPPFNKLSGLPKNINKPFIKRVVEWFTA